MGFFIGLGAGKGPDSKGICREGWVVREKKIRL
jgi:hypothetical protein